MRREGRLDEGLHAGTLSLVNSRCRAALLELVVKPIFRPTNALTPSLSSPTDFVDDLIGVLKSECSETAGERLHFARSRHHAENLIGDHR
jgi:hypothetical protein